jgi:hypothetical protein
MQQRITWEGSTLGGPAFHALTGGPPRTNRMILTPLRIIAPESGACAQPMASGRNELMVVAVDPIAQAEVSGFAGDRDRSHDLADLAAPAEEVALGRHPAANAGRVGVELEWPGVDDRPLRPGHRRLRRDDVQ